MPDIANPCILVQSFVDVFIRSVEYRFGATMVQMGTLEKDGHSLFMEDIFAVPANVGKPFVELVNGTGFYWNTFDQIYHAESTVPALNTTSVMNTLPGTSVLKISGNWDTVDLRLFAQKMYDIIEIEAPGAMAVFNVKVYDSVFDYIRNSIMSVRQNHLNTSVTSVSFDNVYMATWEGHGIDVVATSMDFRNITFNNFYSIFTGGSAIKIAVDGGMKNLKMDGCHFVGSSRIQDVECVDIQSVIGFVGSSNKIGGSDTATGITWGDEKGLKIGYYDEVNFSGNNSESYFLPLPENAFGGIGNKKRRFQGNIHTGLANDYAGYKEGGIFIAPSSDSDWYNTTAHNLEVYISGDVSKITKNGLIMPFVNGYINLEPGDHYNATYTTASIYYFVKR